MMRHFSAMLSTETQPIEVTRHNISTLVTERMKYKEVPLPFVDLQGDLKESVDLADDETADAQNSVDAMGQVVVACLTKNQRSKNQLRQRRKLDSRKNQAAPKNIQQLHQPLISTIFRRAL